MLAASEFEFRHRFWIIGAIFFLAFFSYNLDHQNAGAAGTDWLARIRGTAVSNADYRLTFAVAAAFAIAAAMVRTWATAYLNPEVMMDSQVQTSRLVAEGPYGYVHNPLYFGNILLAVGFGFMASRVGFFILVVGMIVFCYRLILREEAGIAVSQGESYRAYCAAVPRLLPALWPRLPSAGSVTNWTDGLLGEAFMWVLAAAVVAFAFSLSQIVFFVFMGTSFLVYGICVFVITRRSKARDAGARKGAG